MWDELSRVSVYDTNWFSSEHAYRMVGIVIDLNVLYTVPQKGVRSFLGERSSITTIFFQKAIEFVLVKIQWLKEKNSF